MPPTFGADPHHSTQRQLLAFFGLVGLINKGQILSRLDSHNAMHVLSSCFRCALTTHQALQNNQVAVMRFLNLRLMMLLQAYAYQPLPRRYQGVSPLLLRQTCLNCQ